MSDPQLDPSGPSLTLSGIGPDQDTEVVVLRSELRDLRRALENRAVIEQAKGMLVERLRCTPEEAFECLVAESQRANRKLRDIAAAHVRNGTRAHPRGAGGVG